MKRSKLNVIACATALLCLLAACAPPSSQSSAPSQSSEPASQSSQASEPAPPESPSEGPKGAEVTLDGLTLTTTLGFSVQLPQLLENKADASVTTTEAHGGTITTVVVSYVSAVQQSVLMLDEMSTEVWEKVKAEGGPVGVELGTSKAGRVVVMNTLQSNPFAEGSEDYTIFQEWPKQLSVVKETFKFSE